MSLRPLTVLVLTALVLAALSASGCVGSTVSPASGEIKKFSSADEIRQYVWENTKLAAEAEGETYATNGMGMSRDLAVAVPQSAVAESAARGITGALQSSGAPDHSTTNVQVTGVDEPDFVKNDGRYIYVISGDTLTIVDAYPAASATIISKTMLDDTPKEIFVSGNHLVLFTTGPETTSGGDAPIYASEMKAMPSYRSYTPVTHAVFYDVSDRKTPKVTSEVEIDGDYTDARLIGSNLYLVTREQVNAYSDREITVPCVKTGGICVVTPDVYYFPNPERQYAFTTISSFDINNGNEKDAKTYLVGSGNIMYVSEDAMYISYQQYHNVYPVRGGPQPMTAREDLAVSTAGVSSGVSSSVLWEDFNKMSETGKQRVLTGMKSAEAEKVAKNEIDQSTTTIHKIAIDNGVITYIARGDAPGSMKNQFAMDEFNNNLRVATTSSVYTNQGQYEYNNVFVLDPQMDTIGSLTHIAEQEKIYSTRFMGERLYMVTFKRIDPFFVIDLSTPASPKILGKLKIPGYSDYLHPYDKNYVIGLGKVTGTNDWGGVSAQGLKLALFDVSDVGHPRQVGKVEIGDAGSDSAALSDHKAFLFDEEKNLLVIPARVMKQDTAPADKIAGDQPSIWYGAYVFGVSPDSGFTLKGTVEHGTGGTPYYYYGSSANEVKRSLYIGDTLYTISSRKILANPLNAINTTVATITLNGKDEVLYPPMMRVME